MDAIRRDLQPLYNLAAWFRTSFDTSFDIPHNYAAELKEILGEIDAFSQPQQATPSATEFAVNKVLSVIVPALKEIATLRTDPRNINAALDEAIKSQRAQIATQEAKQLAAQNAWIANHVAKVSVLSLIARATESVGATESGGATESVGATDLVCARAH